jgi:hypothetical protein
MNKAGRTRDDPDRSTAWGRRSSTRHRFLHVRSVVAVLVLLSLVAPGLAALIAAAI